MRRWLVCLLVLCSAEVAHAQWGTLKGRVVLDGDVPEIKPLYEKGADIKDQDVCAAQDIPDDSIVIDAETKGIANVAVWLSEKPATIHPELAKPGDDVLEFRQRGCRFDPHLLIVRTDQKVRVVNRDPTAHNPRGNFVKNPGWSFIPPPGGDPIEWQTKRAERLPVTVVCDIHPWMRAYWVVVDHPYATVTDKDGNFEIKDLPAGEHEFKVWHENPGYLVKNAKDPKKGLLVTIKAGETFEVPEIKIPLKTLTDKK